MKEPSYNNTAMRSIRRRDALGTLLGFGALTLCTIRSTPLRANSGHMLIDNFENNARSALGTQWRGISDQVMGGRSEVTISREMMGGRNCLRLRGDVSLENNGGFIQAALNLAPLGDTLDASSYTGIRLSVRGNVEQYSVHLRTPDNVRPWQSYRSPFTANADWRTIDLPFKSFVPYRLLAPLDTARLRRVALVGVGRNFQADLAISELGFYR